jgi:hypothetical protein
MFGLGAAITLVSMSVSVSLSILVPLHHRGLVRREMIIPYIMGANITTFVDTLFAAVLMGKSFAFTIVLAEIMSIAVVSIIILATVYRPYQKMMLASVVWVMAQNRHLILFVSVILIIPVILMLL